ncbi:MAG: DUF2062 domain-containing protein [Verrucomicrobia bacterium]|nr:DUF2062 domain-containing protein [Verrucomicrobiota bacterium]
METRTQSRLGEYFRRKVGVPLLNLFRQGITAEKIAQCLVLGAAISVFPVLGVTTIACTVAAIRLKLNLPAIQAVNWLFGGVHLVLIWPFLRLGEWLFRASPLPLSPGELTALLKNNPWEFFRSFQGAVLHAVAGWLITVVPLGWIIYQAMILIIKRRSSAARAVALAVQD